MNSGAFPRFEAEEDESQDRDRTLRALEGYTMQSNDDSSPERSLLQEDRSRTDTGSEDLFLNIARDDLTREGNDEDDNQSRAERRRVSIYVFSYFQLRFSSNCHGPFVAQFISWSYVPCPPGVLFTDR